MVFICANNAVSALNHSMLKFLSPIPATDSVVSGLTRLSIAVSAALFFSTIAPSAAAEVFTVEAGKAGVLFGNDTLKTVESTLSQIRRRRARGTSGLWPSSP